METKAQLIERIEWSVCILEALQEIDENCNATMFWSYAMWRRIQHQIGVVGYRSWENGLGVNDAKYDKYESDQPPEINRLFEDYEAAYIDGI